MIRDIHIITFLPYIVLSLLGYFLYQKFFKKGLLNIEDDRAKEHGVEGMSNGMSYGQCANTLIDMLFTGGFTGFIYKNTDEKALGTLLLTIRPDEYRKLESVYNAMKSEKLPTITLSRGGSLSEDLRSTFNKKEQKEYMSHLLVF